MWLVGIFDEVQVIVFVCPGVNVSPDIGEVTVIEAGKEVGVGEGDGIGIRVGVGIGVGVIQTNLNGASDLPVTVPPVVL